MGLLACVQGDFWERIHWKVTESKCASWFEATGPRPEESIVNTEQASLGVTLGLSPPGLVICF